MGITTLALVAPGDIITSAQQNIARTNFGVLDSRTGGDPGAAGKIPVSDGATSSIWTVGLTAILALLGYTPLKNTTDTLTGTLTATGVNVGASGVLVTGAGGVNVNGGPIQGGVTGSGGDLAVKGLNVGSDGILSAAAITGTAISGTTGSFSSDLAAAGNAGITGSGTFGGAVGSPRFLSNVADGVTAPYVADAANAGVTCTNLQAATAANALLLNGQVASAMSVSQANVALGVADGAITTTAKLADSIVTSAKILDGTIVAADIANATITDTQIAAANKSGSAGVESLRQIGTGALQAAAGNHTHTTSAAGTYTGNAGGSRIISAALGFSPKLVIVTHPTLTAIMTRDNNFRAMPDGGATNLIGVGSCDANGFTVPSTLNSNAVTYTYVAFG